MSNNSSEDFDGHSNERIVSTIVSTLSELSIHDALNVVDGAILVCEDSSPAPRSRKDLDHVLSKIQIYPAGVGPLHPGHLRPLLSRATSRDSDYARMHFYDCLQRATGSGQILQPQVLITPAVQEVDAAELDRRALQVGGYLVGYRVSQAIDLLAQGLVKWVWSLADVPVVQYIVAYKNNGIWKYYGTEKCRLLIAFLIHEWYF